MTRSARISVLSAVLLLFAAGGAMAQLSDHISAAIIVKELKEQGYTANVDTDDSGDPRVNMKVDGYNMSIYFYDCAPGNRDERLCNSYQFYSGYITQTPVSFETINQWNTTERYAKAYNYTGKNKQQSSRIEIDVRAAGTGANPAQAFRIYFAIMKDRAIKFRKTIGVS